MSENGDRARSAAASAHRAPSAERSAEAGAEQTANSGAGGRGARRRVMGLRDITLYTVSAILAIELLSSAAAVGTGALGWWVLLSICFLAPYGLITAELASAYPEQGGIYVWVRRAFGRRVAARTTYWYWVNVALWMPAAFLVFAGVFCRLFLAGLADWPAGKWPQVMIAIALCWMVVGVGTMRLEPGRWINNIGAALKMMIVLALGIGGIVLAIAHGSANTIDAGSFVPSLTVGRTFLPVIVYLMIGFELVSSMGGELREPQRHLPRALLRSAAAITFLYMFATVGILLALPLRELQLIDGLLASFEAIFGNAGVGEVIVYALGVAALYTFFTNMTTWTMGANRAAAQAAAAGELPRLLGAEHPVRRTPVAAFLFTGVISTAVLLLSAIFIDAQNSLFFAIFAASSVIFLMPYLVMFPAALILRRRDPGRPRPFRIPGGQLALLVIVLLPTLVIAGAILLFIWPEIPDAPERWSYTGPLIGVVVAALAIGEVIIWRTFRHLRPGRESRHGRGSAGWHRMRRCHKHACCASTRVQRARTPARIAWAGATASVQVTHPSTGISLPGNRGDPP